MPEGERDVRSSYRSRTHESLRTGALYREIYRTGRRFRGDSIKAVYRRNTLGVIRLGFSVSKKTGNAARRNLFRRRIRSIVREEAHGIGFDLIVSPAGSLKDSRWKPLRTEFLRLLEVLRRE